jgi:hypothetical protein
LFKVNLNEFSVNIWEEVSDEELITKLDFLLSITRSIHSLINNNVVSFDIMQLIQKPLIYVFIGLGDYK